MMNENDKQHIEAICRRNGIKLLTKNEAREATLTAGDMVLFNQINEGGISFNAMQCDAQTGQHKGWGIYLSDWNPHAEGEEETPEESYFVALHEIGHCMCNHMQHEAPTGEVPTENDVDREIQAWEWAFAHAQYWPTDKTICYVLDCLSTYSDNWILGAGILKEEEEKVKQLNKQFDELMQKKLGLSADEAKNVQRNLHALSVQMTMLDMGLRTLNIEALQGLNRFAKIAKAKMDSGQHDPELEALGLQIEQDRIDRIELLAELAKQYQARFGKDDDENEKINVFPQKPITA